MLTNLFAPAALADELVCYSKSDVNCDWIVDGQDLSFLLGAWGSDSPGADIDGDCTVGGSDLAHLLGNWGALPPLPQYQDIYFSGEQVSMCVGEGESVYAALNGSLIWDPEQGQEVGFVIVQLDDSVHAAIEIANQSARIFAGRTDVTIYGGDLTDELYINGFPVPGPEVFEGMGADIEANGLDPNAWGDCTVALIALAMLHESEGYLNNIHAQRLGGGLAQAAAPDWKCKLAAMAFRAAIRAIGRSFCIWLAGVCMGGAPVTLGGITIACVSLLTLCASGVYAGGQAAYNLALAHWG